MLCGEDLGWLGWVTFIAAQLLFWYFADTLATIREQARFMKIIQAMGQDLINLFGDKP